jgi:hypothetical protein
VEIWIWIWIFISVSTGLRRCVAFSQWKVWRIFHAQRCCIAPRPSTPTSKYLLYMLAGFPAAATHMALIYDTRIFILDPAVWTGKEEEAPCPWQSLAASKQRHGMRSFSKAMPCELGVHNRSRGAYLTTRRTHCGCMARPSAGADTLACCSHSGSLGHALPVAEYNYTAVVQYSTMICSAEHTHTDMHTHTILLCAPTRTAELFAAERDKVLSHVQASTSDDRRRVHRSTVEIQYYLSTVLFQGGGKLEGPACNPEPAATCSTCRPASSIMAEEQEPSTSRKSFVTFPGSPSLECTGLSLLLLHLPRFLFGIPSPSPFPPPPLHSTPPPPRQRHQVVQMPPRLQVTGRCTAREALSALVERQMCHPNSPNPKFPKPSCRRTGRRIDTDPSRTLAS